MSPSRRCRPTRRARNPAVSGAPKRGAGLARDGLVFASKFNPLVLAGEVAGGEDPDGLSAGPLAIVLGAYNACAGSFRASDVYTSEHAEDYTWYGHIWANTKGAGLGLINTVNPVAWWNGLRGASQEFGDTAGRYDSGKATAADVAWAAGKFGLGLGGTALGAYSVGKLGVTASRPVVYMRIVGAEEEALIAARGAAIPSGSARGGFADCTRVFMPERLNAMADYVRREPSVYGVDPAVVQFVMRRAVPFAGRDAPGTYYVEVDRVNEALRLVRMVRLGSLR